MLLTLMCMGSALACNAVRNWVDERMSGQDADVIARRYTVTASAKEGEHSTCRLLLLSCCVLATAAHTAHTQDTMVAI